MFEVTNTTSINGANTIELTDDKDGRIVTFTFPVGKYTQDALKKKIEQLDQIGISSAEVIEDSLAKDLEGKKYNSAKGVFE